MAARSRSADGNETWLTRFFAAAMARRSKEAIRRASASTKPSSSTSGSARLTYPYRSAVSPSKSFAPRTISSARPRPTRCGRRSVPPPPGCTPTPTSGWPSRVFSRAADAATDLRNADHRRLGETDERIHQDREAGRPDSCHDVSRPARQIKVGKVELGIRALECDDTDVRAGVHSSEEFLETFEQG